jgi:pyruvate dehydrogenase E2 component (dihydrolipoamide acetyltransferase)
MSDAATREPISTTAPPPAVGHPPETGKGEPDRVKLPLLRRAMVRQMLAGAAVPCFYLHATADVTDLLSAREELKARAAGPAPSVNDLIVRAVALELRRHPGVNASYAENEILIHPRVNVGVAVAVPGGLVVPAIHDTDRLGVDGIAQAVRRVVELAQARKLTRALLEDATFTVSNLGMYGIESFDPIINPPQAAILAVGTATPGGDGRLRLALTLGCDHRVLTGAEGAPFLTGVRDRLEQPTDLLVPPGGEHVPSGT